MIETHIGHQIIQDSVGDESHRNEIENDRDEDVLQLAGVDVSVQDCSENIDENGENTEPKEIDEEQHDGLCGAFCVYFSHGEERDDESHDSHKSSCDHEYHLDASVAGPLLPAVIPVIGTVDQIVRINGKNKTDCKDKHRDDRDRQETVE